MISHAGARGNRDSGALRRKARKRRPTANTHIPDAARPIVLAVHLRYHALPPICRPPLREAGAALLSQSEGNALAQLNYYPIPPRVVELGVTPREHARRQAVDDALEAMEAKLVAELPDLVAAILEDQK